MIGNETKKGKYAMKILIDGCGYIGEIHLRSLCQIRQCDIALCDIDPRRLAEISARYGIAETYLSLAEALKHSMDGVVICTPNHKHRDDLVQCVKAGINVMLEKPMSDSAESAGEMLAICRQYNRFAFVAYCLRFANTYIQIKQLIDSGTLGKVFDIHASVAGKKAITDARSDFRMKKALGGGVISDFSHEIDYCLWFSGKPVRQVFCSGLRAVHKDWDVQDTADIILVCQDDVNLTIHMDFLQPFSGRSLEICGTLGSIRWRDTEKPKIYLEGRNQWEELDIVTDYEQMYRDEMLHYIDCLKTGRQPAVDAEAGFTVMKIIDACVKMAESQEE